MLSAEEMRDDALQPRLYHLYASRIVCICEFVSLSIVRSECIVACTIITIYNQKKKRFDLLNLFLFSSQYCNPHAFVLMCVPFCADLLPTTVPLEKQIYNYR